MNICHDLLRLVVFWHHSIHPYPSVLLHWHWGNNSPVLINTLRPRQNGCHFADDIFHCIFSNENVLILINISLKFVPKGQINNIPSLVQIMAWRRPGDKPLSEPMMVSLLTHVCVTRPQWVKSSEESHDESTKYYLSFHHKTNHNKPCASLFKYKVFIWSVNDLSSAAEQMKTDTSKLYAWKQWELTWFCHK